MSNAAQKTILFTGLGLPKEHQEKIESLGYRLKVERGDFSEDELIAALQGVSAYILGGDERATRKVMESAKDLEIIAFFGVGYEAFVDAKAAADCGIAVTNTPGAMMQSVAEFTMALMLDAVKRISHLVETTRNGKWTGQKTWNLQGKTLGIVGMGTIGSCVAQIAHHGFGMKIVYSGRSRKPELETSLKANFVPLSELFAVSDVVSLHTAFNESIVGMIGEKELQSMKSTAVLINSSRAELIDPKALYEALSKGKIACAAFDGYYTEPAPEAKNDKYKLMELASDRFLLSPHTAYFTGDATKSMADMSVASVLAMLEHRPVQNVINPEYEKNLQQKNYAAK